MTLIEIGEYIDRKQARPFIKVYLTCLAQGYQLTCPINLDKDELFKSWEKVLAKYRDNFTDEFCQDVTNNWHGLLKRCDMNSSQIEKMLLNS